MPPTPGSRPRSRPILVKFAPAQGRQCLPENRKVGERKVYRVSLRRTFLDLPLLKVDRPSRPWQHSVEHDPSATVRAGMDVATRSGAGVGKPSHKNTTQCLNISLRLVSQMAPRLKSIAHAGMSGPEGIASVARG